MRQHLLLLAALLSGCVAARPGSVSQVSRAYTAAVLDGDSAELRRYLAEGVQVTEAPRDPELDALHVIRSCPQWKSADGNQERVVVLFGGSLDRPSQGLDLLMVKEPGGWRVKKAQTSSSASGAPLYYLRDCQTNLGSLNGGFPKRLPEARSGQHSAPEVTGRGEPPR